MSVLRWNALNVGSLLLAVIALLGVTNEPAAGQPQYVSLENSYLAPWTDTNHLDYTATSDWVGAGRAGDLEGDSTSGEFLFLIDTPALIERRPKRSHLYAGQGLEELAALLRSGAPSMRKWLMAHLRHSISKLKARAAGRPRLVGEPLKPEEVQLKINTLEAKLIGLEEAAEVSVQQVQQQGRDLVVPFGRIANQAECFFAQLAKDERHVELAEAINVLVPHLRRGFRFLRALPETAQQGTHMSTLERMEELDKVLLSAYEDLPLAMLKYPDIIHDKSQEGMAIDKELSASEHSSAKQVYRPPRPSYSIIILIVVAVLSFTLAMVAVESESDSVKLREFV